MVDSAAFLRARTWQQGADHASRLTAPDPTNRAGGRRGDGHGDTFGKIAVGLGEGPAETAFQVGLRGFSALLVKVAGVLTLGILVINVAFDRPLIDALLFSLAIAIGITPHLLPAIVSLSLFSGSRVLARKREGAETAQTRSLLGSG